MSLGVWEVLDDALLPRKVILLLEGRPASVELRLAREQSQHENFRASPHRETPPAAPQRPLGMTSERVYRRLFDLMVDDLDGMHAQMVDLGHQPGAIERGDIHDSFEVREPGGTALTFNSSHVSDLPV